MAEIGDIQDLVDYFKKNLSKGYTSETLKWALIDQGYSRIEISRALELANKQLAESAPKIKEKPKIKYEIIGDDDKPLIIKKSFWKKLFGF